MTRLGRTLAAVDAQYNTLAYRYRFINCERTHLPPGLGVLMVRQHKLSRRFTFFWRFANDVTWSRMSLVAVDWLPLCTSRAAVAALLTPACSTPAGGVEGGTRPGARTTGSHGPARLWDAGRALIGRRRVVQCAGEWVGARMQPAQRRPGADFPAPGAPWPTGGRR